MTVRLSGSAKAVTPFGPMAGRTPVTLADQGTDSAVIMFHCGATPVSLTVAGDNYLGLVRGLIALASPANRAELESELADVLAVAS